MVPSKRVSMGLTVSRNKMLTVKKSNHKIRSRDLLLTLVCYAFMCSGNLLPYWEQQIHVVIGRENYYRNQKCRKCLHNLSDRRFDSSTLHDSLLSFILTGCDGCIEKNSL